MSPCETGKIRYRSRLTAERELAKATLQFWGNAGRPTRKGIHRREQRVYQCPLCHGWHLTSKQKRAA